MPGQNMQPGWENICGPPFGAWARPRVSAQLKRTMRPPLDLDGEDQEHTAWVRPVHMARGHQALGCNHQDMAKTYNCISNVRQQQAKLSEVLEACQKPLDIEIKLHGLEHLGVTTTKNKYTDHFHLHFLAPMSVFLRIIGAVYYAQGRYDDALATWQEVLQVREKNTRPGASRCGHHPKQVGIHACTSSHMCPWMVDIAALWLSRGSKGSALPEINAEIPLQLQLAWDRLAKGQTAAAHNYVILPEVVCMQRWI